MKRILYWVVVLVLGLSLGGETENSKTPFSKNQPKPKNSQVKKAEVKKAKEEKVAVKPNGQPVQNVLQPAATPQDQTAPNQPPATENSTSNSGTAPAENLVSQNQPTSSINTGKRIKKRGRIKGRKRKWNRRSRPNPNNPSPNNPSPQPTPPQPSPEQPSSLLLSDDFSSLNWGNWNYWWGEVTLENGELSLRSQAPTVLSETHSALVISKTSGNDYRFEADTITLTPLRLNNPPNTWEVAWVFFRFQDLANYYYFIFKPNGIELGKKHGSDDQIFLVTGGSPNLELGRYYRWKMVAQGANIQIFIDGVKVIDYTDPNPILSGSIGLYEEDAYVRFDNVTLEALP